MVRSPSQRAEILATSGMEKRPFHQPIGESTVPAGYAAPGFGTSDHKQDRTALSKLATKVLEDPLLLQLLSDRVYQLMQADLKQQQERSRNYRGLF